jgi:hypothetical protein
MSFVKRVSILMLMLSSSMVLAGVVTRRLSGTSEWRQAIIAWFPIVWGLFGGVGLLLCFWRRPGGGRQDSGE